MRRVARRVLVTCLAAIPAAALAADARTKAASPILEAQKAFQRVAEKIYADLISGMTSEEKKELSDALACDGSACAGKAAEFLVVSCPAFTPTEKEAGSILAGKFDDSANEAVARSCAKYFEALQVPLPLLFTHLIEGVQSKKLSGIELEFTARFLAFHASRAAKLADSRAAEKSVVGSEK